MIQVELSPDVEARLQAKAQAQGIEAESYVKSLIENAVRTVAAPPERIRGRRDMKVFFREMAAHSDKIPQLPDEAFTRESFYQDHD